MNTRTTSFSTTFIERQRERLIQLRDELSSAVGAGEAEESTLQSHANGEPQESEDDAQKLALLEIDGTLVARNLKRLSLVEHALGKMETGNYGLSELSGNPIPQDRLEAMPEAALTLAEEETANATVI